MATRRSCVLLLASICLASAQWARAQVLAFGETSGKGEHSIFLAGTWPPDDGIGALNPSATYVRGLSEHTDLYVGAGRTSAGDDRQSWASIGGNVHLRRVGGFAAAVYAVGSFALDRRSESCTLLLNPALILSREMTDRVTLYGGAAGLVPLRHRDRGVFTPTSNQLNFPAGIGISTGSWTVYAEYDIGNAPSVGIGVERSLAKR